MDKGDKRNLIRLKETQRRCAGMSNMQLLRLEAQGLFPKRVYISPTIVAHFEDEVDEWIASRIRGGGRVVPRGERRSKAEQKSLIGHNGGPALLEASPSPAAVAARATE